MNAIMRKKRADFFSEKLSKLNISGKNKEEQQEEGAVQEAPETNDSPVKEVYLIKCPKCGRMVDRERVVKRK
jgi:DNA-directed RNA polymerase subunit M/transcription elongation factor TFIIS